MAKIVFCFAGTGDEGVKYARDMENSMFFDSDVIRVYLRGCQHSEVGNGFLFPDLDIAASKIRSAFEKNQFDLATLRKALGNGICRIAGPINKQNKFTIDSIGLEGFSRGAVTAFATARKLDDLGVPIDIIANQPVPGQRLENSAGSIYSKYNDLRQCQNIRSATTLLGSYNLENGFFHNQFFQQMVAKFSPKTQVNTWMLPHQGHLKWFTNRLVTAHIQRQLVSAGYAESINVDEVIRDVYHKTPTLYFTPKAFSQQIFGNNPSISITKDPIYLELMQKKAKKCLSPRKQSTQVLSDEEASAVLAIAEIGLDTPIQQAMFLLVCQKQNPQAEKFIQIINKVHDTCEYLSHVTQDGQDNVKSQKIAEHAIQYKQAIFYSTYHYLIQPNPSKSDQQRYITEIKQAEKSFETNATSIDRGIMRKAMKTIVNLILHLSGLFLIANTLNVILNGNYLFFNDTRSTTVVKNTSDDLVAMSKPKQ